MIRMSYVHRANKAKIIVEDYLNKHAPPNIHFKINHGDGKIIITNGEGEYACVIENLYTSLGTKLGHHITKYKFDSIIIKLMRKILGMFWFNWDNVWVTFNNGLCEPVQFIFTVCGTYCQSSKEYFYVMQLDDCVYLKLLNGKIIWDFQLTAMLLLIHPSKFFSNYYNVFCKKNCYVAVNYCKIVEGIKQIDMMYRKYLLLGSIVLENQIVQDVVGNIWGMYKCLA